MQNWAVVRLHLQPCAVAIGQGKVPCPTCPVCVLRAAKNTAFTGHSIACQAVQREGMEPMCSERRSAAKPRPRADGGWQGGSPPARAHHWFLITAFSPERLPVPRHPLLLLLFPLLLLPAPSLHPFVPAAERAAALVTEQGLQ